MLTERSGDSAVCFGCLGDSFIFDVRTLEGRSLSFKGLTIAFSCTKIFFRFIAGIGVLVGEIKAFKINLFFDSGDLKNGDFLFGE